MFRKKLRKLNCRDVKSTILWLGFQFKSQKGSHEHYHGEFNGVYRKVTIDCPKAPFTGFLIRSMASQAGLGSRQFWELCADSKKKYSKMPKGYGKDVESGNLANGEALTVLAESDPKL